MCDSNTDFCLTKRQDHARSSSGTGSPKVLPRTPSGTALTRMCLNTAVMWVNLGYVLRLQLSHAGQKKDNIGSFGVKKLPERTLNVTDFFFPKRFQVFSTISSEHIR